MKGFIAVLCIAALLSNGVALADGGKLRLLQRGLAAHTQESGKLAKLFGKAKQYGAGVLLATALTCGMLACTKGEVANTLESQNRVATLDYEQDATLKEIIAGLELVEGAQIGIVKSNEQGLLTIATENGGAVYLQLSGGEVLVNSSETPLKVILSEADEGWIGKGSLIAIIPAGLVALGGIALTGMVFAVSILEGENIFGSLLRYGAVGVTVTAALSYGTYYLLLLL